MNGSQELKLNPSVAPNASPSTGTKRGSALTQERVRELFDYDPETGILTRKSHSHHKGEGIAGRSSTRTSKSTLVRVENIRLYTHHVIWLWWYGGAIPGGIYHANDNKLDNRLTNLVCREDRMKDRMATPIYRKPKSTTHRQGGVWKRKDSLPTQAELLEAFNYSPETGELLHRYWKGGTARPQQSAYKPNPKGYLFVTFNRRIYPAARLVWCMANGYWPENEIDHINRDRSDNRISNLREVSRVCNQRNKGTNKNNKTTGIRGVSYSKGGYKAQITIDYRNIYLGIRQTLNEAVILRWLAEVDNKFTNAFEDSPAYLYILENNLIPKEKLNEYSRID